MKKFAADYADYADSENNGKRFCVLNPRNPRNPRRTCFKENGIYPHNDRRISRCAGDSTTIKSLKAGARNTYGEFARRAAAKIYSAQYLMKKTPY
jgi:hypothetical protein